MATLRNRYAWQQQSVVVLLVFATFLIGASMLLVYHSVPLARGETDGISYMMGAESILAGNGYANDFHGPGYSTAIALAMLLVRDAFLSAKLISLGAGLVFLLASFRTIDVLFDGKMAAWTLAFLATNTTIVRFSVTILSDMLAACLFVAALYFLVKDERLRSWGIAGLLAGLAYLTRYVYLSLPIAVIVLSLVRSRRRSHLARAGAFLLAFLATSSPWLLVSYRRFGTPFHNLSYLNIAFAMYQRAQSWTAFPSAEEFPSLASVVLSNPALFLASWARNAFDLLRFFVNVDKGSILTSFFFVPGLILIARNISRPLAATFVVISVHALFTSLVWIEERFVLPLIPFFTVCALHFLLSAAVPERLGVADGFGPRIDRVLARIPLRKTLLASMLVLNLAVTGVSIPRHFDDEATEYRDAAARIAQSGERGVGVMAAKPHVPYFSGNTWVAFTSFSLHAAAPEQLGEIVARAQPQYFVYDERYAAVEFSQLRYLLDPTHPLVPDSFTPIYESEANPKIVVYRVLEADDWDIGADLRGDR